MRRPAPDSPAGTTEGRPRIAFLAAYLNDEYEWAIWRGVRQAVEARGGSVACFAGAGIRDPSPERQARNALFDLVHPSVFDGILCLSSVVGNYAGVQGTEAWLLKRRLLATYGAQRTWWYHGREPPHWENIRSLGCPPSWSPIHTPGVTKK